METKEQDQKRIDTKMVRCDVALGKVLGLAKPDLKDVRELASATHNLLGEIRVVENSKRFGLNGYGETV